MDQSCWQIPVKAFISQEMGDKLGFEDSVCFNFMNAYEEE